MVERGEEGKQKRQENGEEEMIENERGEEGN